MVDCDPQVRDAGYYRLADFEQRYFFPAGS